MINIFLAIKFSSNFVITRSGIILMSIFLNILNSFVLRWVQQCHDFSYWENVSQCDSSHQQAKQLYEREVFILSSNRSSNREWSSEDKLYFRFRAHSVSKTHSLSAVDSTMSKWICPLWMSSRLSERSLKSDSSSAKHSSYDASIFPKCWNKIASSFALLNFQLFLKSS